MSGARTTREPGEIFGPRMTLFADVLSVGLATAVASLPLLTAPAALSTACEILRGTREDRPATAGRYFRLLRQRLRAGDLVAGLAAVAGVLLVLADLALARTGLPGGPAFAVVAAAIGAYAAVTGLRACGRPESLTDWPSAVRAAARDTARDPGGSALVLLALATDGRPVRLDAAPARVPGPGSPGDGADGDRRTYPHGAGQASRRAPRSSPGRAPGRTYATAEPRCSVKRLSSSVAVIRRWTRANSAGSRMKARNSRPRSSGPAS